MTHNLTHDGDMQWPGQTFTDRLSRLVLHRDLDSGLARDLYEAGDEQLLAQLERATDAQLADLSRDWRKQQAALAAVSDSNRPTS